MPRLATSENLWVEDLRAQLAKAAPFFNEKKAAILVRYLYVIHSWSFLKVLFD